VLVVAALLLSGTTIPVYADGLDMSRINRNIKDACSGRNPDGLLALKALGIGCNGEKLTPGPEAKFASQSAKTFYEAAREQPEFRSVHECALDMPCQTVETATRNPRNGDTLKDTFITFDNGSHKVWCVQNLRDLYRLCNDAKSEDGKGLTPWMEAYFPNRHHWVQIEHDNPACKDKQYSQYYVDNAYIACMVAKFDTPRVTSNDVEMDRKRAFGDAVWERVKASRKKK
jgi:hypothetical protein